MNRKADFYDQVYKGGMALLALFAVIILGITAANIIAINHRTAEQAERTNEYLRCTSLTPVDKRTPDFVDQCFKR